MAPCLPKSTVQVTVLPAVKLILAFNLSLVFSGRIAVIPNITATIATKRTTLNIHFLLMLQHPSLQPLPAIFTSQKQQDKNAWRAVKATTATNACAARTLYAQSSHRNPHGNKKGYKLIFHGVPSRSE